MYDVLTYTEGEAEMNDLCTWSDGNVEPSFFVKLFHEKVWNLEESLTHISNSFDKLGYEPETR